RTFQQYAEAWTARFDSGPAAARLAEMLVFGDGVTLTQFKIDGRTGVPVTAPAHDESISTFSPEQEISVFCTIGAPEPWLTDPTASEVSCLLKRRGAAPSQFLGLALARSRRGQPGQMTIVAATPDA